jgi:P63C domain
MIAAAGILIRGLADVGIIGLVDEATGYQRYRARDALAKILEEFIAKELRPYVRLFPEEFYEQLFRLRGLNYPRDCSAATTTTSCSSWIASILDTIRPSHCRLPITPESRCDETAN